MQKNNRIIMMAFPENYLVFQAEIILSQEVSHNNLKQIIESSVFFH